MTNQKAIRILDGLKPNTAIACENESAYDIGQALCMAIKALEQEPCDDAISLEVVIEWLKDKDIIKLSSQEEVARKELKALSSVNPQEPKTGYWIDHQEGRWVYAKCSECGTVHDTSHNYCPSCGAKMVEGSEKWTDKTRP